MMGEMTTGGNCKIELVPKACIGLGTEQEPVTDWSNYPQLV